VKQTKPESSHVQFWNMFMIIFGTVLASNREGGVGFDLHFRSERCSWGVVVSLPWIYLTLPVRMTVLGHRLEMLVFKRQLQNTNLPLELIFQVCCRFKRSYRIVNF